jgi:NAD(P)-dependent dehydrogenase (short-subunit alcohol dehydrogenase family)
LHALELFNLKGKVALITGGGRGFGKQIAEAFSDVGCDLVLCSRNLEACQSTAEILRKKGVNVTELSCDVTNENDIERTVNEVIKEFGKIDILVNNSGVSWQAPVEEMELVYKTGGYGDERDRNERIN